uniref:DOP1 leucine zipper like protein B n=1 Tax=Callorhinchus milii TaxID=7868 RepID=A0A4W3JKB1_CALMI
MDQEELDLINDYRYRNYAATIDKALKNFESSSEWADLISSLGKLNKALQSNLKYSLLPKRLIISKRLAQCLHPALPSGVHLKALETYEVIFKIIGAKWLSKDLFFYSSGLFPLLGNAAMSVKPALLGLYEKYYLPLQKSLCPSLQAFITGLLPGLEEGSEIYERTDVFLQKLSLVVGQEVFYGALWASVLFSPSIRLPASLFVVSHLTKSVHKKEQKYMFGADPQFAVKAFCASVQDSNVLVQRNTLEILFFFFPLSSCLDPDEWVIPLTRSEMVHVLSAGLHVILRRDMSLNRRLYAWLLGTDIKGGYVATNPAISTSLEDQTTSYFSKHSRDLLVRALILTLQQINFKPVLEHGPQAHLKPFRILISLLDKPELGPEVIEDLLLEVIRAFYSICNEMLDSDILSPTKCSVNSLYSIFCENKNALEVIKTVNLLISALSTDYLWDYMTRLFEDSPKVEERPSEWPTVLELCCLMVFLLEVVPLELCSEIQTQFLPQMLHHMVDCLVENMESLGPTELTTSLRTCYKILSKIQLPAPFMDEELQLSGEGGKIIERTGRIGIFPSLRSEDSGIGLSVMGQERSHSRPDPRVSDVWKSNGSVQATVRNIQQLLAHFTLKHFFGTDCQHPRPGEDGGGLSAGAGGLTGRAAGDGKDVKKQVTVPQFKQMLSDFFTVRAQTFKQQQQLKKKIQEQQLQPVVLSPGPGEQRSGRVGKEGEEEEGHWDVDRVLQEVEEVSEDCRLAFAATCQLLLECASFPVYLSCEEIDDFCFDPPGNGDGSLPLWLKSLMTLSCCISDCHVQNVATSTLLEIITRSQSLELVLEDKVRRYKISGHNNPFLGKLQMMTVPPIPPATLKLMAEKTNFYQRVSHVLWNQLNKESREHHVTCVELFYKLHCLAPSANICEDIICQSLLHRDKATRLETLFRFSVLWHFTRDIQGDRTSFCARSFDRCLFVVLDSLNCSDGAIGVAAQGWLVRALSLNDVARILEPVLLLLLNPKTQRTTIQCLKKKVIGDDLQLLLNKKAAYSKACSVLSESSSEESVLFGHISSVDREALWAEVEGYPERSTAKREVPIKSCVRKLSEPSENIAEEEHSGRTESLDASSGAGSTDVTSSASLPSPEPRDSMSTTEEDERGCAGDLEGDLNGPSFPGGPRPQTQLPLVHTDSEKTQTSQSLSSDEEEIDLELQLISREKLLKRRREKHVLVEALFKHVLLYGQPYDAKRVLYAFSVLEAVLKATPKEFIEALSSTSMDTTSIVQLNLINNLLARHQESLDGQSFYGKLPAQSSASHRSLMLELLTYLCLSFLRSYYPCQMRLTHKDLLGNREVQVNSVEVLIRVMTQLVAVAKPRDCKNIEFIGDLLSKCKVQEYVLLALSASMYISEKSYRLSLADRHEEFIEEGLSEESLVNFGEDQIWSEHPLQIELLKLLQVLIVLEHHLGQVPVVDLGTSSELSKEWQRVINFQQSITAMDYVQSQPIISQGMFVSAVVRALQPQYGYSIHPPWVSMVTASLPYLEKSLGLVVAPFVAQICRNLDSLVQQYERESEKRTISATTKKENIPPDYPLTLLEGLTAISHFCLLDSSTQAKKSAAPGDSTSLKNARNAILEELSLIINCMSVLWGVIRSEESQRKPVNLLGVAKGSYSVYFKSTKTFRQKILDLLNPFAAQMGVHLMAAVAAVWNKKKGSKRQSKTKGKILPVASEAQLTLVDLVQGLDTLKTDRILQLIKDVVKKPQQTKGEEKPALVDIPMLQFSFALLQRLPTSNLQEVLPSMLSLLKESVQLNLAPPGHFLLMGILNDFMLRIPNLENKREQKDLQEVSQKIIEAVGNVVGSSLEQTSWLSRSLEVKAGPQVYPDETNPDLDEQSELVSTAVASPYSVQALTLLAEVLAPLLDMVYRSDEKDKAVPLISRLLYYVFPYLRNHSAYNVPSFRASAQLLSSLSGYAYTKRAWKKEAYELFMDPLFFQMDASCISHWKSIIDHLLTHEKTMFKDLMSTQSSSLKLFANYEQKAMLVKRQAFAIFSGELDQYHSYLPLIQERMTETLRVGMSAVVTSQMFLTFRVLMMRISPQHLTSLWPIMVTELVRDPSSLQQSLTDCCFALGTLQGPRSPASNGNDPLLLDLDQSHIDMYLSACKFLDTALSFPPEHMPLFQMYRWAFVPEVSVNIHSPNLDVVDSFEEYKPQIGRIVDILDQKYREMNDLDVTMSGLEQEFPLLTVRSVSSIHTLTPFFRTLNCIFKVQPGRSQGGQSLLGARGSIPLQSLFGQAPNSSEVLQRIEENIACDFLEVMMEH